MLKNTNLVGCMIVAILHYIDLLKKKIAVSIYKKVFKFKVKIYMYVFFSLITKNSLTFSLKRHI